MRSTKIQFTFFTFVFMLCMFSSSITIVAQSSQDYKWYLNAHAGAAQLFGDIQNEDNILSKIPDETELGYGLRFGRYLSPVFGVHLHVTNGNFKGSKDASDVMFSSTYTDLHLAFQINLLNLFFENKNRFVNPYAFVGGGAIFYRSEAWIGETGEIIGDAGYNNDIERTESSREMGLMVPVGLGFDFRLADKWYMNLETGLRLNDSDLLDGVENGSQNDAYYYTSLGLSYYFGARSPKPDLLEEETAEIPLNPFAGTKVDLRCFFPPNLTAMDEFMMNCQISKGKIDGKAELTQVLPIGFNVLDTAIANASRVEFKNYTLSLYWDELPTDSVFNVTYNVQLDKIYGSLPMSSILYLEKMGREYKFKNDVSIKRLVEAEPIVIIDEEPEIEKVETQVAEVEFKVQVQASYKKQLSVQGLEEKYNLRNQIQEEKIGYWYKYVTGSFNNYDDARGYRNSLIKNNGVAGAFVIAYFNGSRLDNLRELQTVSPDYYPYPFTKKTPMTKYCYKVQILALLNTSESVLTLKQRYGIDEVVNEEVYHSWRKYTVGDCYTKSQALKITKELKDKGVEGAFPVLYKNGERTSPKSN
ncbi:MAG: porin family protein [Bacteroidetes bacterium]|nr:porin family protein [Bacteroidota bacterium]